MVLQLDTEVSDMTVDDVAFSDIVRTPEVVENFVPSEQTSGVGSEQVEQTLFECREMQLRLPGSNTTIENVNFQIAKPKDRREHYGIPISPPHDRQYARNELLRGERYCQDVVHSPLERRELGFEIATSRERDDREPAALSRHVSEPIKDAATGDVHVEHDQLRFPVHKCGCGFLEKGRHPCLVVTVIERKRHDLG